MWTLKALRVNKGLTQLEAAKMLEISPKTLHNYEKGYCYPDVITIEKIMKLYGVHYDDIQFFLPK